MISLVIVDDNLAFAEMISSGIDWAKIGCSVEGVAHDGTKGQALIIAKQPDIIISDIHMPGLDGLKMIEMTRTFSPRSKVIFVSAYDDFAYARKAIAMRACDYLLKPFSKKELVDSVKAVILEMQAVPEREENVQMEEKAEDAGSANLLVDSMLEYVHSHISCPLKLSDLSRHFGISPSYISLLVKKQTGRNYSDWVTQARINYAKQLLRKPTHRIEEIAFLVGYKNYVTFYKVFVKLAGMSPTDYRNLKGGREREDQN